MLNMNLARNLECLRVRNESPAFLATRAILKVRACHFATSLVRGLMIRGQEIPDRALQYNAREKEQYQ